jgi:hypothetical protein
MLQRYYETDTKVHKSVHTQTLVCVHVDAHVYFCGCGWAWTCLHNFYLFVYAVLQLCVCWCAFYMRRDVSLGNVIEQCVLLWMKICVLICISSHVWGFCVCLWILWEGVFALSSGGGDSACSCVRVCVLVVFVHFLTPVFVRPVGVQCPCLQHPPFTLCYVTNHRWEWGKKQKEIQDWWNLDIEVVRWRERARDL